MRLTSSRLWGKLLPPERKEEGALQRKKREGGGSPLHPGLSSLGGRARPVRPRPAARAAIQAVIRVGRLSVVAVGRQCLNVLVFLPELLFGASEQATVETSRPVRRRTHRRTDATAKVRHTKKRKRRPDDAGDATDASSADSLMFHTTVMDYESIELIGVRTVRCVRTCFPPRARASCLVCSTARRPCPPAVPHVDFFLLADVWEKEKEKKKKKKKKKKKGEK